MINILSTLILLIHMKPIQYMARVSADGTLSSADHGAQIQLVVAAGAGLLALLVATGLAVYKPRGMTASMLSVRSRRKVRHKRIAVWLQSEMQNAGFCIQPAF
jgi:hypothetical protein